MKQSYSPKAEAFEAVDNFPVESGAVRLRIEGLVPVGDGIFDLRGIRVREIDWDMLAMAVGRELIPEALASQIDQVCFRYDVAEILSERIERR